jgi:AI-2 transport protein TqsA
MTVEKVIALLLGIITVIIVGAVLQIAQSVMIPLAIAVLLFFIFSPLIAWLETIHIPRLLAIFLVILLFFGLFYLFGLFMYASAKSFIIQLPKYQARFAALVMEISQELFERFSLQPSFITDINWSRALQTTLLSFSGSLMGFVGNLLVVTLFLIFLLLEKNRFEIKVRRAFHIDMSDRIYLVMRHIDEQIGRYLSVKFVISFITAVLVYTSLVIIGLDFPILWGSLAFFLNFVPNIGSAFVVIVTIIMSFIQFYPEGGHILAVAISMASIQILMGNIIDPRLQGRRLNLSPFLILVGLLFWGWLWGIVGMFMAVPFMVIIKLICENIPALRPIGILMGSGGDIPPRRARVIEDKSAAEEPPEA